jgi:peptide/nickel transport system permease protein
MKRYIVNRLLQAVVCILLISVIVFMIARLTGDPIVLMVPPEANEEDFKRVRELFGLDRPLHVQYWIFISGAIQGNFGISLRWNEPCMAVFIRNFRNTLLLGSAAMLWAALIAIPTGILCAVNVGRWFDNFGKIYALLGQATPVFWVGIMLMLIFAARLRLFPTFGMGSWKHLVLPSFTLGWYFCAAQLRLTRSAMLDVLDSEYIKMARVKGLPERLVILKHAFKNASIPVITMAALQFIILINGTVITETVFAWPGVGRLAVDSIFARDYPMVQTIVFISSCLFVSMNLIVDILYAYLDPRIRYQ